jgi:hypothetical protein
MKFISFFIHIDQYQWGFIKNITRMIKLWWIIHLSYYGKVNSKLYASYKRLYQNPLRDKY